MAQFMVEFHDQIHNIDAYAHMDLGPISDPEQAKAFIESDFAGCHFEVRRVDPLIYVPIEQASEANMADFIASAGEC